MNFIDLKSEVLSNLQNHPNITPRELDRAVNRAYKSIASFLGGINTDFTYNIVTQTERILLPFQVLNISEIRYIKDATDRGMPLAQVFELWTGPKHYGLPTSFYIDNVRTSDKSVLYLNPIPDSGQIRMDATILPSDLVNNSDTPRLKEDEQELVILKASVELARRYMPELYGPFVKELDLAMSLAAQNRLRQRSIAEFPTMEGGIIEPDIQSLFKVEGQ